ncbi:unnamed protein product [Heterobilharzia americana]|nr:unnamed protein product [Heterobilharzia americana]
MDKESHLSLTSSKIDSGKDEIKIDDTEILLSNKPTFVSTSLRYNFRSAKPIAYLSQEIYDMDS